MRMPSGSKFASRGRCSLKIGGGGWCPYARAAARRAPAYRRVGGRHSNRPVGRPPGRSANAEMADSAGAASCVLIFRICRPSENRAPGRCYLPVCVLDHSMSPRAT